MKMFKAGGLLVHDAFLVLSAGRLGRSRKEEDGWKGVRGGVLSYWRGREEGAARGKGGLFSRNAR